MELTPEEKQRIYLEEKARLEAREQIQKEILQQEQQKQERIRQQQRREEVDRLSNRRLGYFVIVGALIGALFIISFLSTSDQPKQSHAPFSPPSTQSASNRALEKRATSTAGLAVGASEPPDGFRAFKWGATLSGNLKKVTGPTADGVTMYVPSSGKGLPPLFDLPVAEEAYFYSNGKFYSGSSWLDGTDNFEKMKNALTKAFGQPSFTNEHLKLWKWKWPGSPIEVHLTYQAKFSRTTVIFVNNGI